MTKTQKALFIFAGTIFVLVLGNTIFLDYKFFFEQRAEREKQVVVVEKQLEPLITPSFSATNITRKEVEDIVRVATASISIGGTTNITNQVSQTSGQRELVIALGSGESTANDWSDVPGVEAYIDTTKYNRIKSVVFEASLYTPTGNQTAYVRLYNVTDKNMVWPSELSIEGGEPKLLISPPLGLSSGNKLYRVQMKTQLRARTQLVQARVRITTE